MLSEQAESIIRKLQEEVSELKKVVCILIEEVVELKKEKEE